MIKLNTDHFFKDNLRKLYILIIFREQFRFLSSASLYLIEGSNIMFAMFKLIEGIKKNFGSALQSELTQIQYWDLV